jgi:hypothetical protein
MKIDDQSLSFAPYQFRSAIEHLKLRQCCSNWFISADDLSWTRKLSFISFRISGLFQKRLLLDPPHFAVFPVIDVHLASLEIGFVSILRLLWWLDTSSAIWPNAKDLIVRLHKDPISVPLPLTVLLVFEIFPSAYLMRSRSITISIEAALPHCRTAAVGQFCFEKATKVWAYMSYFESHRKREMREFQRVIILRSEDKKSK